MKRKTAYVILPVLLVVIAVMGFLYYKSHRYYKEPVPEAVSISDFQFRDAVGDGGEILAETKENSDKTLTSEEQSASDVFGADDEVGKVKRGDYDADTIPEELNLSAPFFSQAPYGNWDYPWQEACEEASVLIIANVYFDHNWSTAEFNDEILKLVEWEKERFGQYEHTNMEETAEILEDYLGLETNLYDNPGQDDIKMVLARGHLIVMPFAGKRLGNPFYNNGGPNYHVMVIKGYKKDDKIIAHDVGTKRGEDYVYSWDVIDDAFHDYADPIESGSRIIIEVIPPGNQ